MNGSSSFHAATRLAYTLNAENEDLYDSTNFRRANFTVTWVKRETTSTLAGYPYLYPYDVVHRACSKNYIKRILGTKMPRRCFAVCHFDLEFGIFC